MLKLFKTFCRVYVALLIFIVLTGGSVFARGKVIELSSGALVNVLSIGRAVISEKGTYVTAKIKLLRKGDASHSNARIADEFFRRFGINLTRMKAKKAAVIFLTSRTPTPRSNVFIKSFKETSEWYFYKLKEPGLWLPEKRALPQWLKIGKEQKSVLSNGQTVYLEKVETRKKGLLGKSVPMVYLRTEIQASGSKEMLSQIRRYGKEKLGALRAKHEYIMVTSYLTPAKDGINIRRRVRAFILKKNGKEFWLAGNIIKSFFTGSKTFSMMLYYHPEMKFSRFDKAIIRDLREEAQLIQKRYGERIASRMKVDTAVILAQWGAEKAGMKVPRYGSVFRKNKAGVWEQISRNK